MAARRLSATAKPRRSKAEVERAEVGFSGKRKFLRKNLQNVLLAVTSRSSSSSISSCTSSSASNVENNSPLVRSRSSQSDIPLCTPIENHIFANVS